MTPLAYPLADAALAAGVAPRTLTRAIADGALVARYAGTKVLIRADDLAAWLDSLPTVSPAEQRKARRTA